MEDIFQKGTLGHHPHRGIETVTYVNDGILEHFDNKAGYGKLETGDVQWMTAGNGVIHKEDPASGTTVHSLQLWVNLLSSQKMTEPPLPKFEKFRRSGSKRKRGGHSDFLGIIQGH